MLEDMRADIGVELMKGTVTTEGTDKVEVEVEVTERFFASGDQLMLSPLLLVWIRKFLTLLRKCAALYGRPRDSLERIVATPTPLLTPHHIPPSVPPKRRRMCRLYRLSRVQG